MEVSHVDTTFYKVDGIIMNFILYYWNCILSTENKVEVTDKNLNTYF